MKKLLSKFIPKIKTGFLISLVSCFFFISNSNATTRVVTASGMIFTPSTLNCEVGDTIKFEWLNGTHTTTSTSVPAGATTWNHPLSSSSTTFLYKVTKVGTYNYQCNFHFSMGMIGSFTASAAVTASISSSTNVLCNGGNTGIAIVSASAGATPYTYLWSPGGQTTATATGLTAGTYTVKVTDGLAESVTASVTLTQPSVLASNASVGNNATACANTGSASSNPTGGASPYTYSWTGGSTNATATGLSAGSYTVNVKDKNGCTSSASIIITAPSPIAPNATVTNNASACANSGSATASPSGGTSPYTYLWTGGNTNSSVSGLSAGSYIINVTDKNGCTASASIIITAPSPVTSNATVTGNASACANTGSASSSPSGGTSPYTYLWTGGSTNVNISGLSAGGYTVTVTDNNGCTANANITITSPTSITTNESVTVNATACANKGVAIVAPAGGNSPYTYLWTSGSTNFSATGLSAGIYSITVTDNNGCAAMGSVAITAPANIAPNILVNSNATACNNTGSATSNPSGGNAPYNYLWTGGNTTSTATGLSAGNYTVTVTDNDGCTGTSGVTISAPAIITPNATVNTNATECANTGSAMANPSGGNSPYNYVWTGGNTNNSVSGLSVGSYTVTVTDNDGCSGSSSLTITAPAAITPNASVTANATECANKGSATANPGGGNAPYTYLWTGGSTNANISGLSAGTYSVSVTDNNGCTATASVVITVPTAIVPHATVLNNANCIITGSAISNPTGGTSPYTYLWTGGNTTSTATGLSAGSYTITVSDNNGCSATAKITITAPAALAAHATVTANASACTSNGTAQSSPTGGNSPYTYSWSSGETTSGITGKSANTYTVTVKDKNGCSATGSVNITQPNTLMCTAGIINNISCFGANNGRCTVTVTGGTTPFIYSWTNAAHSVVATVQSTPATLTAGSYTVSVLDSNGCSGSASITITQPKQMRDSILSPVTEVGCNGGSGGAATAGVKGGTYPYIYNWSNGTTLATASNLSAGSYTVSVTDQNGCTATHNPVVTITQPSVLHDSLVSLSYPLCNGGKGTASVGVIGGTSPYTYTWTGALSTTALCTKLTAGSYTVTVKDKHSCTAVVLIVVTQPVAIHDTVVSSSKVNVLCNGGNNGAATVGVKYGIAPYTYLWNPGGQTNITATGLTAGIYSITVTDNNGCSSSVGKVTITQPGILRDSIKAGYTCTNNLATATVGVKGGTIPYTYLWSPGGGTKATMSNLAPGTYTITVTDKNNCSNVITSAFTCPPSAEERRNQENGKVTCCGDADNISLYPNPNTGQFTLTGLQTDMTVEMYDYTGRKLSSQLTINNSQLSISISDQSNGIYLIRILDKSGTLVSQKKVVKTN